MHLACCGLSFIQKMVQQKLPPYQLRDLPSEVISVHVLKHLNAKELISAARTCKFLMKAVYQSPQSLSRFLIADAENYLLSQKDSDSTDMFFKKSELFYKIAELQAIIGDHHNSKNNHSSAGILLDLLIWGFIVKDIAKIARLKAKNKDIAGANKALQEAINRREEPREDLERFHTLIEIIKAQIALKKFDEKDALFSACLQGKRVEDCHSDGL